VQPTEEPISEVPAPSVPTPVVLQSPQQKMAEFIGDVLSQLSVMQQLTSAHISEIADLQAKVVDLETRVEQCEAFKKAIKLRLRQQQEGTI
jgi:hypothetical protein